MREFKKIHSALEFESVSIDGGSKFLTPDTMLCFNSKLYGEWFPTNREQTNGIVVISNRDKFAGTPREYAIVFGEQWVGNDGLVRMEVDYANDSHYATKAQAVRAGRVLAEKMMEDS